MEIGVKKMVARVTEKMIFAAALIAAVAIAFSGYLAFIREPAYADPVMQMMQQMHDSPQKQLYRTLFLAITTASAIAIGSLLSIYYLQGRAELGDAREIPRSEKIELLAEDERAVLKAVMENPGLRQGELVSLTGFSKAKTSQLLTEMERRGLIYREKQKKKYFVYPTSKVQ